MPTYEVTDPNSGMTLELTGDSPPTEQELEEIFASQVKSPSAMAPQMPEPEVPAWGREYPNIYGAAGAAYETLAPAAEALGAIGGGLLATPAGPAGIAAGGTLGFAGARNIKELAGQAIGVEKPKTVTEELKELPEELAQGAVAEMGGQVVGKVVSAAARPITKKITSVIKTGIEKGIRPSLPSVGKTAGQRNKYFEKAEDAVQNIIANKNNLSFVDDAGNEIKGELPKTLNQFADSIAQTKKAIFSQYDDIAKAAGDQGAIVDLRPLAEELNSVTKNKVLNDLNPEVVKYAKTRIGTLLKRGGYTTKEAQEAISALNSSLESFYRNPSYDAASKAHIDALIANNLRKNLDNVIEESTGAGYQALKNSYGALKAIEKDVNRRALVDARKNIKGLIDFSDILSGAGAVNGLLTLNPATMASAATAKGITAWHKWVNNPNRIIQNMFRTSENLIKKASDIPTRGKAAELATKTLISGGLNQ